MLTGTDQFSVPRGRRLEAAGRHLEGAPTLNQAALAKRTQVGNGRFNQQERGFEFI